MIAGRAPLAAAYIFLALAVAPYGAAAASAHKKPARRHDKAIDGVARCLHGLRPSELDLWTGLSARTQRTVPEYLGPFVESYLHDDFDCDEIARVLRSAEHLIRTAVTEPRRATYETPFPKQGDDTIYVWVNPVCPVCRATVDQLLAYQRAVPDAPPIIFRVVPTDDPVSRYAALTLEVLRLREPELFNPVLIELLGAAPQSEQAVDAHVKAAFGESGACVKPSEYEVIEARLRSAAESLPADIGTPTTMFRGRWLNGDRTGSFLFDPLRSIATIDTTIRSIIAVDHLQRMSQ